MGPDYVIDDGADLITMLHTSRKDQLETVLGANEETTTGVIRLRSMAKEGKLRFPVMAVNDAQMKFLFDNRYGTGQSTFDGFMNATNLLVAGKTLVVAGYGWCGRGIAMRAKGLGANVVVTEVDPIRAIEARMEGYQVMPMAQAAPQADIVISATGCKDVVRREHLQVLKDGCVLGNSGHFDNEVSRKALEDLAGTPKRVREFVDEYRFQDGRRAYLIAEGRLMNLSAGQGHPVEIMDMSFSIQALALGASGKELGQHEARRLHHPEGDGRRGGAVGPELDGAWPSTRSTRTSWTISMAGKRAHDVRTVPLRVRAHQPGLHHRVGAIPSQEHLGRCSGEEALFRRYRGQRGHASRRAGGPHGTGIIRGERPTRGVPCPDAEERR